MKRIYIAHPYIYNPAEARQKVDAIVKDVYTQGYLPISPIHLFGWLDNDDGVRDDLLSACSDLLFNCDELHYYGLSAGVEFEIKQAKEFNIKIVDKRVVL